MQLEIEEAALAKEKDKDKASKQRLVGLRKELADSKAQTDALRAQYDKEKEGIQEVRHVR